MESYLYSLLYTGQLAKRQITRAQKAREACYETEISLWDLVHQRCLEIVKDSQIFATLLVYYNLK